MEEGRAPKTPDGTEGGPALVVRPPDYTEEEARQAQDEYEKSGRSMGQDQATSIACRPNAADAGNNRGVGDTDEKLAASNDCEMFPTPSS